MRKKKDVITDIEIGPIIQEKFKLSGLSKQAFADKINTHRNNVYDLFTRKSVDTELLAKISNALDYNFFLHYVEERQPVVDRQVEKRKKVVFLPIEIDDNEYELLTNKIIKI